MIIQGVLEWKDYLHALRLHMQPRPWLKIIGYILITFFVIAFAFIIFGFLKNKSDLSTVFVISFCFLYLLAWYSIYVPYKAKKVYRQQKSLQLPFEVMVTKEGLNCSNEIGKSNIPWGNFLKWKENNNLFLIYYSDVLFQMLPKRLFNNLDDINAFRSVLSSNIKRQSNRTFSGKAEGVSP